MIHALLLLLSLSPSAHACSCVELPGIEQQFAENDIVAEIKVTKKRARNFYLLDGSDRPTDVVYTANVPTVYKGKPEKTFEFMSAYDSAACGLNLAEGEKYLLWYRQPQGHSYGPVPYVHLCSGTRALKDAKQDVEWLKEHGGN